MLIAVLVKALHAKRATVNYPLERVMGSDFLWYAELDPHSVKPAATGCANLAGLPELPQRPAAFRERHWADSRPRLVGHEFRNSVP